jgi:hypothetical protein
MKSLAVYTWSIKTKVNEKGRECGKCGVEGKWLEEFDR